MEEDPLTLAQEELKRADHLMYVSLKYTRTVDVIKSIVDRLVNTFDYTCHGLLEHKKVKDIPTVPKLLVEAVKRAYTKHPEAEIIAYYMHLYLLLRSINKATFERGQEFRRHVVMTAHLEDKDIEVTIDIIEDYFNKVKEFLNFAEKATGKHE